MTDIVVLIACAACGFCLGMYAEKRIRRKNAFYADLVKYIELFALNIDGRQLEVDKFNADFAKNCSANFAQYLAGDTKKLGLSAKERQGLEEFFADIGRADTQQLKKFLEHYRAIFEQQRKIVEQRSQKASVYAKLGFLLGLMLGILLI